MDTRTCRSCGAPIIWVKTAKGKVSPLNAEPDPDGKWVIVLDDEDVSTMAAPLPMYDTHEPRYTSHFATCPQASQHRRRGGE